MTTQRFFRYLWRTNGVLIFLATGTLCALGVALLLSEASCNARRGRAEEAAPPVAGDAKSDLYLGPLTRVEGSDVLRGELLAHRGGLGIGSGSYGTETRNILYLDTHSAKARWLLEDSGHVIAKEISVWTEEPGSTERRQVAVLALVKPLTSDIAVVAGTLLIFDPEGRRISTVAEDVRALDHASLIDDENIQVLFARRRMYVRSVIDAHSFKVSNENEVSVPEQR
jgi:hypothetical protein